MIDHVILTVSDFGRSVAFYAKALKPLGITNLFMLFSTGLDWGYYGNGPAQCALAILADALSDDLRAVRVHNGFHARTIANLPRHLSWQLTQAQVIAIVEDIESTFPEE